jgi:hypothetical protein
VLLWKPFSVDARPPRWFKPGRGPAPTPGQVTVTAYVNGWCMAQNLTCERARRAAAACGERVVFQEIDTSEHATVAVCGLSDALFIDGKPVRTGPPPTFDSLKALIEKRLRKLSELDGSRGLE